MGFGVAAGRSASERRRRLVPWVIYGAILGPVALLLLRLAPPGRCWACDAASVGWTPLCLWCGSDLTADPRRTRVVPEGEAPTAATKQPMTEPAARPTRASRTSGSRAARSEAATPGSAPTSGRATPRRAGQARRVAPAPASPAPAPPAPSSRRRRDPEAPTHQAPTELRRTLATGVFVTGTVGLRSGSRYLIALAGQRLQILGPAEDDPTAVVFERPVGEADATGFNERLVISQAGEAGNSKVLVFMALAGGTPEAVADEILGAAASSQRNAS